MSDGTRRPDGIRPDGTPPDSGRPADVTAVPDASPEPAGSSGDDDAGDEGAVLEGEVVGGELDVVPPAPPQPAPAPDYDEHGVPSFAYVRDKIEGRYATGLGATELAAETAAGRSIEQQEAERAEKAAAKLEEIRRSLGR